MPKVGEPPKMAFLDITPSTLPLTVLRGGSIVLRVAALAPWWAAPNVIVNVTAFGLTVNTTTLQLQGGGGAQAVVAAGYVKVSADASAIAKPYLIRFGGVVGALNARRWVHVVAAGADKTDGL
jgi:hypothetical protein